jgi:hypothetical protein
MQPFIIDVTLPFSIGSYVQGKTKKKYGTRWRASLSGRAEGLVHRTAQVILFQGLGEILVVEI